MNDTKENLAEDGDLPIERVWRVGDYFKSLFARSLKLGLDHGLRERPRDEAPAPVDQYSAATDAAGGREPEENQEEERNGS